MEGLAVSFGAYKIVVADLNIQVSLKATLNATSFLHCIAVGFVDITYLSSLSLSAGQWWCKVGSCKSAD